MFQRLLSYVGWQLRMPWFLFWPLLFALTGYYLVRRVISWDLWWHMAAGRFLVENGVFWSMFDPRTWIWGGEFLVEQGVYPTNDTFTFSPVTQTDFISQTWLGDIIFHGTFEYFGFYGLQVLRGSFILTGVLFMLHLCRWRMNIWTLLGSAMMIIGTMQKHLIKNAIIIIPFISYLAWSWIQIRYGNYSRRTKAILLGSYPIVFIFWTHFHGSAIVGLYVLMVVLTGEIIDSWIIPQVRHITKDNAKKLGEDILAIVLIAISVGVVFFLREDSLYWLVPLFLLGVSTRASLFHRYSSQNYKITVLAALTLGCGAFGLSTEYYAFSISVYALLAAPALVYEGLKKQADETYTRSYGLIKHMLLSGGATLLLLILINAGIPAWAKALALLALAMEVGAWAIFWRRKESEGQRAKVSSSPFFIVLLFSILCLSLSSVENVWGGTTHMLQNKTSDVMAMAGKGEEVTSSSSSSSPEASAKKEQKLTVEGMINKLAGLFRTLFGGTDAKLVAEYQFPMKIDYVLSVNVLYLLVCCFLSFVLLWRTIGKGIFHYSLLLPAVVLLYISMGYLRTVSYPFVLVIPVMAYVIHQHFAAATKDKRLISAYCLGILSILTLAAGVYIFNHSEMAKVFFELYHKVLKYAIWLTVPFLLIPFFVSSALLMREKHILHKLAGAAVVALGIYKIGNFGYVEKLFGGTWLTESISYHYQVIAVCVLVAGLFFAFPRPRINIGAFTLVAGLYIGACLAQFIEFQYNKYEAGDFHNVSGFLDTEPGLGKSVKFFDGMAEYVQDKLPRDKEIYNSYNMGGYLQWKWYGERRVFIDGRSIIFQQPFYQAYTRDNAQEYIRKHDFEHAILNLLVDKDRLTLFLRQGWTPIAFDPGMTVLQRPKSRLTDTYGVLPTFHEGEVPMEEMGNLDHRHLASFINSTLHHMMLFGRLKDGLAFMNASKPVIERLHQSEMQSQLKGRLAHLQQIIKVFGPHNHPRLGELCKKLFEKTKGFDYHLAMADAHFALGQYDKSEAQYGQAHRLDKSKGKPLLRLGQSLHAQNKLDQAMGAYQVLLNLQPKNPRAHNAVATTLMAKGDVDRAIQAAQTALQFQPDFAEAHANLGAAMLKKKNTSAAISSFRRALQLNPQMQDVRRTLQQLEKASQP